MTDVFNNPSNDYIYPGLAPCPGVADEQYLTWTDEGLSIIKGTDTVSTISFDDLKIPVNSYSKEQLTLGPGEISFIQGLTKGLCNKSQGFTMPSLVSEDETKNPYFFQVDLSINYISNFSFTYTNIDASANYGQNITIESALNIALNDKGIKVSTNYDPSILTFTGVQEGYEFNVSNVLLTLIDASQNASSPFIPHMNAEEYLLNEDPSHYIPAAKYPNSAMQGIILRGIYPYEYESAVIEEPDKWVYVNHVSDYVTVYDPETLNFDTEVSTGLSITYDPSTYIGDMPIISIVINVNDSSCRIIDVSINLIPTDASASIVTGTVIDGSIVSWRNIYESPITISQITDSNIYDSSVHDSDLSTNFILGNHIYDSSIVNSGIEDSIIVDAVLTNIQVSNSNILSSLISDSSVVADPSTKTIVSSTINNSWIINYIVSNGTAFNSYFRDSAIAYLDASSSIIDDSSVWNSNFEYSEILCSEVKDSSIKNTYIANSDVSLGVMYDVSIFNGLLVDVEIDASTLNYMEDTSIFTSTATKVATENCAFSQTAITNSEFSDTKFGDCSISDSSIFADSIINNESTVSNSLLENIWTNTYKLLVYEDPSTLVKTYEYITNDDTTGLDVSLNTVHIYESAIWDSSLNNAVVYDSSIYNTYIEDSELIRCTTYNCTLDTSTTQEDTRDILIDPSIGCAFEITSDTSTYYIKRNKRLEIGQGGCGDDEVISAGEYLNLVTTTGQWKKVGDMYIWTSAPDYTSSSLKNLIDGFYVYNAHMFPVQVEYMVFV